MPFQTTVEFFPGAGIPGQIFLDGPLRAQPVRLNTTPATNNVFGSALTIVSGATGTGAPGDAANPAPMVAAVGGTGVFAGILANPKEHTSYGNSTDGPFGTNFALPNGTIASAVQETAGIIVTLPAGSAPGQTVYFLTADGTLVTTAAGAAAPAGANAGGPIGKVERFLNAAASLAVISVLQPARPAPGA